MKRCFLASVCLLSVLTSGALASGILIPRDDSLPALAIQYQRVEIEIKDGVAGVRIEQVFRNHTDRDLEAVYVFPLPEDAAIADFAMMINGRRVSGELVEKDRARQIYQDIVRRLKDPGLLEYLGGNLFRVSVYPVPRRGDQKIELTYSQPLAFDGGMYRLVYPLKTGERASRTLDDFTLAVRLTSAVPVRTVYSPSHAVGISRKTDHEIVLGFEEEQSLLDRDFELFYSVSDKTFGLNLLTHAGAERDGYFMMMLAPGVVPPDGQPLPKDVVFVLDTSGSMSGEKIAQARRALAYCVRRLNPGDRFNLIRFSTDVDPMSNHLIAATEPEIDRALAYIEKTVARGGTAIDDALAAALGMDFDPARAALIVFLTDGKPTIGESDPDIILRNVNGRNPRGVRLFVFGVGDAVNTRLLDRLAGEQGGVAQYVRPTEDIEVKLSAFADKISDPVLARPRIEIDRLKIDRIHPRTLPDLFGGEQILLFGRYQGSGHVAIRLLGEINGESREFVYEGTFPETQAGNEFIPRLWATRRIGFLLDAIRSKADDPELKEEIIRLSREYGVMTPYTSYLVLEDEKAYQQHGLRERSQESTGMVRFSRAAPALRGGSRSGPPSSPSARPDVATGSLPVFDAADAVAMRDLAAGGRQMDAIKPRVLSEAPADIERDLRRETGAEAVTLSQAIRSYRDSETLPTAPAAVRHVGRRIFYYLDGRWVDSRYRPDMTVRRVAFGSDDYFALLTDDPTLKPCLALGQRVTLVLDDQTALIIDLSTGHHTRP